MRAGPADPQHLGPPNRQSRARGACRHVASAPVKAVASGGLELAPAAREYQQRCPARSTLLLCGSAARQSGTELAGAAVPEQALAEPLPGRRELALCRGSERPGQGGRAHAPAQKEQPHDGAGRARSWCEPITAAGVVAAGVHSNARAGSAGAARWRLAMCFDSPVTLARDTSWRMIDRPSSDSPLPSADAEV
jgi:hypothetical protein